MPSKSDPSSRPPGGGASRSISKRTTVKRRGAKKPVTKKVARRAVGTLAYGHALQRSTPVVEHGRGRVQVSPASAAPRRQSKFTVITGKADGRTFEGFGGLASAEREAAIRAGLPASFLDDAIARLGVTRAEVLAGLGIASSTAARVKQQRRSFSLEDSERLGRVSRLWHDAFALFETDEGTRGWLTNPVPSAGGVPLAMLATQEGFERAHRSIMQLAYGVFA